MKKIWLILFGLTAVTLLCIRFMVIDIIQTDKAGECPNSKGFVLVNRLAYGISLPWNAGKPLLPTNKKPLTPGSATQNDWVAYHQPAIVRGEKDDRGTLHLGKVMAAPGDTLWYNNEDGLIDTKHSPRFSHPLIVPAKGKKLFITNDNIQFYAITIMLHEPSKVCIIGDSLCVSGEMVDTYTFSQDYYWIHNSDTIRQPDSRSFGFIPHKSLTGKVVQL